MSNFFKKLIYREDGPSSNQQDTKTNVPVAPGVGGNQPIIPVYSTPKPGTSALVDDFVDRLQKLIEANNQQGFDFLEFLESLFESNQNPSPMEYQMIFRVAKKMNANLSAAFLLESARQYKTLVETAASSTIAEGTKKKENLMTEKTNKRQSLSNEVASIDLQMEKLQKQIEELRQISVQTSNQLNAIDAEFQSQFDDIDSKIIAMNTAKEKVISSIVDVEVGIQANIK